MIPAYNAETDLGQCLDGLSAQQTDHTLELIVVDDGSSDGTAELARAHGARVICQENAGPATARNRGAREASGEVLVFTDSDCRPLPEFVEQLLRPMAADEVDAVKGAYVTDQRGLGPRFAQAEFENRYRLLARAARIDFVDSYAMAIRRELFLELNGFDESFPVANNEDTEFSYRLASAGHQIVFAPRARTAHRHRATLWQYLKLKVGRGYWRMVVYRKFPGKAVSDSYTPQTLKLQILLAPLALLLSAVAPLWQPAAWAGAAAWTVFVLSCLPLALTNLRRDPLVALLSPALCLLRALAFVCGIGGWLIFSHKKELA